eukprot:6843330-Prymnesium_polylepis.1
MGHALPPSSRPFAASHTFSSTWDAQRSALLLFGKRTGDAEPRLLLPPRALLPADDYDEDEPTETADVHPVDLLTARRCADTVQSSSISPFCLLFLPTSDAEAAARNAVAVLQSDTLVRSCEGDGRDVASTITYKFDRLDATAAVAVPRLVTIILRARRRWQRLKRLASHVGAAALELLLTRKFGRLGRHLALECSRASDMSAHGIAAEARVRARRVGGSWLWLPRVCRWCVLGRRLGDRAQTTIARARALRRSTTPVPRRPLTVAGSSEPCVLARELVQGGTLTQRGAASEPFDVRERLGLLPRRLAVRPQKVERGGAEPVVVHLEPEKSLESHQARVVSERLAARPPSTGADDQVGKLVLERERHLVPLGVERLEFLVGVLAHVNLVGRVVLDNVAQRSFIRSRVRATGQMNVDFPIRICSQNAKWDERVASGWCAGGQSTRLTDRQG